MDIKRFDSSEGNVFKYVFTEADCVYEAVLYRYGHFAERTVLCVSVQSGCPVGCVFCGTGKKFIKNLSYEQITGQVRYLLMDMAIDGRNVKKFQIMFMSMGEPFLNYMEVELSMIYFNNSYPNADLLISTVAPFTEMNSNSSLYGRFLQFSKRYDRVGLQFSIHRSTDEARNVLIPYKQKHSLEFISSYGKQWSFETSRKAYCNYCIDGTNNTKEDAERLMKLFPPDAFCFTFSVICSPDETMKDAGYRNIDAIKKFQQIFIENGYNTRIFNPDGQDDIGGGCGQLWYVQKWLKDHIQEV